MMLNLFSYLTEVTSVLSKIIFQKLTLILVNNILLKKKCSPNLTFLIEKNEFAAWYNSPAKKMAFCLPLTVSMAILNLL